MHTGRSSGCFPRTPTPGDQSWTPEWRRCADLQTYKCLRATQSCDKAPVFPRQLPAHRKVRMTQIHVCIFNDFENFGLNVVKPFNRKCSCLNQSGLSFFNVSRLVTRTDLQMQLLLGQRMEAVAPPRCRSAWRQVGLQDPAARL